MKSLTDFIWGHHRIDNKGVAVQSNNKTGLLNRICALIIIISLFIIFVQKIYRHRDDIGNTLKNGIGGVYDPGRSFTGRIYDIYIDIHNTGKESIKAVYSSPPREEYFQRLHYEYLKASGRGHYNGVTFLNDGRMVLDTLDPEIYLAERTDNIKGFRNYLSGKGIPFLYVRIPNKLQDNSVLPTAFSNNYIIDSGDRLLEYISDNGVDTFDLRAEMVRDDIDFETAFYRYHIHWTFETVLWASQKLVGFINREYGFTLDQDIWALDRYDPITFQHALYGSEARTVEAYRVLDDVTLLFPKFHIELEMSSSNHGYEVFASDDFFEVFLPDIYYGKSEFLVCNDIRIPGAQFTHIVNKTAAEDKRVLLISDSFSLSWTMFLSLGIRNFDFAYLINDYTAHEIWDFLDGKEYDLVVLAVSDVTVSNENMPVFEHDRLYLGVPPNR